MSQETSGAEVWSLFLSKAPLLEAQWVVGQGDSLCTRPTGTHLAAEEILGRVTPPLQDLLSEHSATSLPSTHLLSKATTQLWPL